MKSVIILCIMAIIIFALCYINSDPYSFGTEAYENGKYELALKYFYRSLNKRSNDPEVYLKVAKICLYETKNLNDAQIILQKGLERFHNNFELYYEMMVLYFEKCDIDNGLETYKKLANISNSEPFSITWKAIKCMENQMTESEFQLTISNLLKLNNRDCVISRIVSTELLNQNKYSDFLKSIEVLKECGELLPLDYFKQGMAYYYLEKRELSLQNFRKAYSLGVDAANFYSKSLLGVSLETERSPVTEGSLDPSDRTEK